MKGVAPSMLANSIQRSCWSTDAASHTRLHGNMSVSMLHHIHVCMDTYPCRWKTHHTAFQPRTTSHGFLTQQETMGMSLLPFFKKRIPGYKGQESSRSVSRTRNKNRSRPLLYKAKQNENESVRCLPDCMLSTDSN